MVWPAEEFLGLVEEQVEALIRAKDAKDEHHGFALWVLTKFYGLDMIEAQKATSVSGHGDAGIDAMFHLRGRLFVLQCKTSDPLTDNSTFNAEAARDLDRALKVLRNPEQITDQTIRLASKVYQKALDDKQSVELVALISGQAGQGLIRAIDLMNADYRKDKGASGHHCSILQQKDLNSRFVEELAGQAPEDVEIDIGEVQPAKKYHTFDGVQPALVVDVDGLTIAKWVQKNEYGIIAKNLRYPLSSRYNEDILDTLRNDAERRRFWYYNNGLTVLCDKLTDIHTDKGLRYRLVNPQIVNGCQTAFTIRHFLEENPENEPKLKEARMLLRVIPIDPKEGATVLDASRIAQFTNSQNAITERDLRSNDQVQGVLQQKFDPLGFFYERKNGEWKAFKGPAARAKGGFRRGRIENPNLAQLSLAFWLQGPQEAKNERRLLFRPGKEGWYDSVFRPDQPTLITPEDLLLPHFTYEMQWIWAKQWLDTHKLTPRSQASSVNKVSIVKDGDFYILALTAKVLQARYGVRYLGGAGGKSHELLAHLTEKIDSSQARMRRKNARHDALSKSLWGLWEDTVEAIEPFCAKLIVADRNLTVRKIFVRRSTYADRSFKEMFGKSWVQKEAGKLPEL